MISPAIDKLGEVIEFLMENNASGELVPAIRDVAWTQGYLVHAEVAMEWVEANPEDDNAI